MITEKKIYRGFLRLGSSGEADDILFLLDIAQKAGPNQKVIHTDDLDPLSKIIAADIEAHGRHLTVRYFTADHATTEKELTTEPITIEFGFCYEDYGHNFLRELRSQVGRFCHLEITYGKEPAPESVQTHFEQVHPYLPPNAGIFRPNHFQGAKGHIQVNQYVEVDVMGRIEEVCGYCGISRVKHSDEKCRMIVELHKVRAALSESVASIDQAMDSVRKSVE